MSINTIKIEDFKKIELRVAKILEAEKIPQSDKLIKLLVSLGEEKRQIIAGIGNIYTPEILVGKQVVVVANLEPKKIIGFESQGMLLAASDELGPVLIIPESDVEPGTILK